MAETLLFRFRKRYNLPPNDPRLLALTMEDIEADFWAHHYHDNPAAESAEDDEWDTEAILASMENDDEWDEVINDKNQR